MNELPKVERTTLTMRETAEYLEISYWLVNQLVRRKQIPCARVGGRIMMSENAPMTVEDLAIITHKSNKKIQNILDKLIHFEMIICEDSIYRIKNWDKYQSADKYEKIQEQNRERQRRFREKSKEKNNVNVTLGNEIEENKKENNRRDNKKSGFIKREQREYSPEFLESLYDNLRK